MMTVVQRRKRKILIVQDFFKSQELALTLFITRPFLVYHIDSASTPHDLIVRTNFFD